MMSQNQDAREGPDKLTPLTLQGAFLLLPVIGVLAPKGLVALMILVGGVGLWRWNAEGRPMDWFPGWLAALLAALVVWGAVSALWSISPSTSIALSVRLAGLLVAGLGFFFVIKRTFAADHLRLENLFFAGCLIAVAGMIVGFAYAKITGDALWGQYQNDPLATMNNGAVAMTLLIWPLAGFLWRRGKRAATLISVFAVLIFLLFLSSGAALLAFLMGVGSVLLFALLGRRFVLALATLTALAMLVAPALTVGIPDRGDMTGVYQKLPASGVHRLLIWRFVGERIDERPLLGWGLDASRAIDDEEFRLDAETEILPLHPHNAALQVRLELGFPGALMLATLVLLLFNKTMRPVSLGALTVYLVVGGLSFGMWQNWWIVFAWALASLLSAEAASDTAG